MTNRVNTLRVNTLCSFLFVTSVLAFAAKSIAIEPEDFEEEMDRQVQLEKNEPTEADVSLSTENTVTDTNNFGRCPHHPDCQID